MTRNDSFWRLVGGSLIIFPSHPAIRKLFWLSIGIDWELANPKQLRRLRLLWTRGWPIRSSMVHEGYFHEIWSLKIGTLNPHFPIEITISIFWQRPSGGHCGSSGYWLSVETNMFGHPFVVHGMTICPESRPTVNQIFVCFYLKSTNSQFGKACLIWIGNQQCPVWSWHSTSVLIHLIHPISDA